jgi:hypothetical protein
VLSLPSSLSVASAKLINVLPIDDFIDRWPVAAGTTLVSEVDQQHSKKQTVELRAKQ